LFSDGWNERDAIEEVEAIRMSVQEDHYEDHSDDGDGDKQPNSTNISPTSSTQVVMTTAITNNWIHDEKLSQFQQQQ